MAPILSLDGVTFVDGRYVVDPAMIAEARESIKILRANAAAADEQASGSGIHRRRALERVSRNARTIADRLEIQCDRTERGVK